MSNTRPLSALQRRNTMRLVCDGIRRFSVGRNDELTYSEAYELILDDTGSKVEADTHQITFTPEAIKRITNLNVRYINCAQKFLRAYASEPKVSREQPKAALGGE